MDRKKMSEAQKKAMRKYDKKFDILTIRLPKGTVALIHSKGYSSINSYINELIRNDINGGKDGNL